MKNIASQESEPGNLISVSAKDKLFNVICLLIGTMMLYRGITDTSYPGFIQRELLAPVFLGGALGIYLMYRRYRVGFWLFTALNCLVGFWFIFILQDMWYHHVLPHVVFSAVFLPFYRDMRPIRSRRPQ